MLSLSRYPGILISLYERNSFFFLRRWIEESRCILRLTQVTSLEANPSAVSLERQAADLLPTSRDRNPGFDFPSKISKILSWSWFSNEASFEFF